MGLDKSKLKITPATFREASDLKNAIGRALSNSSMNFGVDKIDKENPFESELSEGSIGEFLKSIIYVGVSREVEDCLFVCAKRAVYGTEKINEAFFDIVTNRGLYYPIIIELIKVNIFPFIEDLFSQSGGLSGMIKNILK